MSTDLRERIAEILRDAYEDWNYKNCLTPANTRPYRDIRLERLADPVVAAHYLNTAIEDSPEMFLKALRNVAQARKMARVAKGAGVTEDAACFQADALLRELPELSHSVPLLGQLEDAERKLAEALETIQRLQKELGR